MKTIAESRMRKINAVHGISFPALGAQDAVTTVRLIQLRTCMVLVDSVRMRHGNLNYAQNCCTLRVIIVVG